MSKKSNYEVPLSCRNTFGRSAGTYVVVVGDVGVGCCFHKNATRKFYVKKVVQ